MRTGIKDVTFLAEGGRIMGVCLGWDFVAEHEWGIGEIQTAFGIPGKPESHLVGADVRAVTKVPSNLRFFDFPKQTYLLFSPSFRWRSPPPSTEKELDDIMGAGKHNPKSKQITIAAWSGQDFGVRTQNRIIPEGRFNLGQIYEALQKKDALIFLAGAGNPFSNRGLYITIRSRMSPEMLEQMRTADEGSLNLSAAAAATGIRARVDAAGKRYYALSPRFVHEAEKEKTVHPVIFWLNPTEQGTVNFGWFTVEELDQWIAGTGPIPKTVQ